jgi:hypothetical protein
MLICTVQHLLKTLYGFFPFLDLIHIPWVPSLALPRKSHIELSCTWTGTDSDGGMHRKVGNRGTGASSIKHLAAAMQIDLQDLADQTESVATWRWISQEDT